jgi:putative DNA primase/helicase
MSEHSLPNLQTFARALGGEVQNNQVLAPGPGHSANDRSLSVRLDSGAPDGFVVHSFANNDPIACKDYVREKVGLDPFKPNGHKRDIPRTSKPRRIAETYDYHDDSGTLGYQVVRYEPKDFRQRRPDGNDGWVWNLDGVRRVPYRWPELLKFPNGTVFVCEGEKDADRVASLGHCATTVACGTWTDDCVEALAGRDIIILEDNDEAGRKKATNAANALNSKAKTVRIVRLPDLPEKGDVSDWLDADPHNTERLVEVCFAVPLWKATSAPDNRDQKVDDDLVTTAAASLEMCGVDWLWPGRFARGKFGLIAGLPDMGKGQIAAFITAAVTAAVALPCDEGKAPQGNVIWFNAEDGESDTVLPRLIAAGADPERVHFVNSARIGGEDRTFSLITDLRLLRKAIKRIGNVVLVIIDPVSAYLGVGKVDGRSATDVRGVLTPLKDMAEELHVAVIGVAHFNKKDDIKSALLRVSDSIAYVAAARHVYAVVDDPEDKNSKLFVKAKNNLARDTKALRYGMSVSTVGHDAKLNVAITAPYVVWHPQHVEITANEAMEAGSNHTAKREAKEFLRERLQAGAVKQNDILDEAKQEGIAEKTLRRAKKELSVKSRKETGKMDGGWLWELPKQAAIPPKRESWPSS